MATWCAVVATGWPLCPWMWIITPINSLPRISTAIEFSALHPISTAQGPSRGRYDGCRYHIPSRGSHRHAKLTFRCTMGSRDILSKGYVSRLGATLYGSRTTKVVTICRRFATIAPNRYLTSHMKNWLRRSYHHLRVQQHITRQIHQYIVACLTVLMLALYRIVVVLMIFFFPTSQPVLS